MAKKDSAKKKEKSKKQIEGEDGDISLNSVSTSIIPHTGKEPYAELREKILICKNSLDQGRWDLAENLWFVKHDQVYLSWGYNSWEDYVCSEVEYNVRTAQYLTSIYEYFAVDLGEKMSPNEKAELIEKLKKLGWTKARSLVQIVSKKDVMSWIEKAKKMSSLDLEVETRKKLNEAKGYDSDVEKKVLFSVRMSEENKKTCDDALTIAEGISESDDRGWNISLVCMDFVATHLAKKGDRIHNLSKYLDQLSACLSLKLIALDKETDKVVYGEKAPE